jgi:hypothetical protein
VKIAVHWYLRVEETLAVLSGSDRFGRSASASAAAATPGLIVASKALLAWLRLARTQRHAPRREEGPFDSPRRPVAPQA